jgi:hypothetical protein
MSDELTSVLPNAFSSVDRMDIILSAQNECDLLGGDNQINVLLDEEIQANVIELLGTASSIVFPVSSIHKYLVIYVKSISRFFSFDFDIVDDTKLR